ncbi:MAG: hypothetical protein J6J36_07120 [Clostridia bacterium]|nr:hypothetical protein [Clostridia bacterium]
MELPNGWKWEIRTGTLLCECKYSAIVYDPKEEGSHKYKTGWWGADTLEYAQELAIQDMKRMQKKYGANY